MSSRQRYRRVWAWLVGCVLALSIAVPALANSVTLVSQPVLGSGSGYTLTVAVSWAGAGEVELIDEVAFGLSGDDITDVDIIGQQLAIGLPLDMSIGTFDGWNSPMDGGSGLVSGGAGPLLANALMDSNVYYHGVSRMEISVAGP